MHITKAVLDRRKAILELVFDKPIPSLIQEMFLSESGSDVIGIDAGPGKSNIVFGDYTFFQDSKNEAYFKRFQDKNFSNPHIRLTSINVNGICLEDFLHEISHVLEIENSKGEAYRLKLPDLGMGFINVTKFGKPFKTMGERELRTSGIQWSLMHLTNTFDDHWSWDRTYNEKIFPNPFIKNFDDLRKKIQQISEEWTEERILEEWNIKTKYIKKYWVTHHKNCRY